MKEKTLMRTLTLSDNYLRKLWNAFIEESGIYGGDSYIYDLTDVEDCKFLLEHMDDKEFKKLMQMALEGHRYIQWVNLGLTSDNGIYTKKSIRGIVEAYWDEIFERIMCYPKAYNFEVHLFSEDDITTYFDDVFFPTFAQGLGYIINVYDGTMTSEEKSSI